VPFHVPFLGPEEPAAAAALVRSGLLGGGGAAGREVEVSLRRLTGAAHAFFVTSCTHAMELALMALGVGPADEVIVPSFTFPSTATCVLRQGARPVFAEIDARTWTLDPGDVAACVTKRTRAVIAVHYAGHPARLAELRAALPARCALIEDAAHALGARVHGEAAGAIGDAGCFSFHISKNVTCGEGGALLLRDPGAAARAECIREKGTNRSQFLRKEVATYAWVSEGSSFVASDLLAAVLLEQLKKLEAIRSRRETIWLRYAEALSPLAARGRLQLPALEPGVESSYHIFAVLVDPERREEIRLDLLARGIEAPFHYLPLHSSPHWSRVARGAQRALPVTERVSRSLLRLPIYPGLTPEAQERVVQAVREVVG
jgi:dTDP-4-amino-4,6-dideoxygalactose transaminase